MDFEGEMRQSEYDTRCLILAHELACELNSMSSATATAWDYHISAGVLLDILLTGLFQKFNSRDISCIFQVSNHRQFPPPSFYSKVLLPEHISPFRDKAQT